MQDMYSKNFITKSRKFGFPRCEALCENCMVMVKCVPQSPIHYILHYWFGCTQTSNLVTPLLVPNI